ncbi:MAG: dTMP kinase [Dehalococcoidia bacterium]|jgi:dTMP kinase|nr:dTMP kinase [Dehalococcoidia bacterium]
MSGLFVTFEGGERAGKSTQIAALAERIGASGHRVVSCREPGGTALGERLRDALFAGESPGPEAELLIFASARAQLVHEVIRPALDGDAVVLCDRFSDSTVAYQQYGRGLDSSLIAAVNEAATGGLTPALTVLLDLSPAEAQARGGPKTDYMEREALAFHERVRDGYLTQAAAEPQRWLVLDATGSIEHLTDAIWERIASLL